MSSPLVSIITPTYNRADYLGETIQSVLAQTYPHFEMLIVDNGSTDNTRDIVASFEDPRIRYFHQQNSGNPVSPRNTAFQNASGDIITYLDSDDSWLPEKLSQQVGVFENDPAVGLVYSDCFLMNNTSKTGGRYSDFHRPYEGEIFEKLLWNNFIPTVTVAIRRSVLEKIGCLDEKYSIAHDLDLYLKVCRDHRVAYIPEPLAKFRIHGASMTRNRMQIRSQVLDIVENWRKSDAPRVSPKVMTRIAAYHHFRMGLELIFDGTDRTAARRLLRQAIRAEALNPIYWAGFLISAFPRSVLSKIFSQIKKRKSVESVLSH